MTYVIEAKGRSMKYPVIIKGEHKDKKSAERKVKELKSYKDYHHEGYRYRILRLKLSR